MSEISPVRKSIRKILAVLFRRFVSKNYAGVYTEALNCLPRKYNFMLFYGNLLFHTRGDAKPFIDDIDLLLLDHCLNIDFIEQMTQAGFKYSGIVMTDQSILAIKFNFKGCPVDIHCYNTDNDLYVHEAVHFREEIAQKHKLLSIKYYKKSYIISFNPGSRRQIKENLFIPSNADDILKRLYGRDWKIPKSSNFSDYTFYEFKNKKVTVDMTGYIPK